MAKKITALILSVALIAAVFSSCSASSPESETTTLAPASEEVTAIPNDDTTFKLSYTKSDSLNPFEAATLNNQIVDQLVFESLFDTDDNYKSSLNIATSYEYTDSTTLEVAIQSGSSFSDGSELSADDVVYSFKKAAESPFWGNSLSGIESCRAESESKVIFKLKYPNSYAHNLLVFPIVSSSGDENGYPVGSGRYSFADEDGETVLKAAVTNSFSPHITTIHLENITSSESIDNAVNIGNISFAFRDLSRDSSRKISAGKKLVNMNNLVYIGVNNKSGCTSNSYIRKAVSLAVDRETLVKSAYGGFAQTANSVFNPQFELSTTKLFEKNADANAAKQAISQSGVSDLSLSLLVNGDNTDRVTCAKLVKQELEAVGFSVNLITAESYEQYQQLVTNESFNLYIGEIKLPTDMALHSFLASDGSTHYGIEADNSKTAEAYYSYISGDAELGSFLLAFSDEMPYIPLLYRKGMICFTKAMNGDIQGTYNDCFSNIEDWYFSS